MGFLGFAPYPSRGPRGSYFIWSGEANQKSPELVAQAKLAFNDPSNFDGKHLKVILGTQTIMEGVDFKNVNQIHILDPWWNDSRMQQVIARGMRLCSHRDLPPEQRVVNVFIHLSTMGSYENVWSLELKMLDGSEKTVKSFMQVENLSSPPSEWYMLRAYFKSGDLFTSVDKPENRFLVSDIVEDSWRKSPDQELIAAFEGINWKKLASWSVQEYMFSRASKKLNINRQFEKAIKEVAIDCSINKNGNMIRLDEVYTPNIQTENTWNLVYENYSTGEQFKRVNVQEVFTIQDILNNVALNSGEYSFQSLKDGSILKLNKSLVLPEDIKCDKIKYSFDFPPVITNLTKNKEIVPYLFRMNKNILVQKLLDIMNETLPVSDVTLPKKLREFLLKKEKKRKIFIDKLKEAGFTEFSDDSDWDKIDTKTLENMYKLTIKQ